jgi:DNA ligase (NAD+)
LYNIYIKLLYYNIIIMSLLFDNLNNSHDQINFISNLSVNELEYILIHASDKYYNTSKPIINDDIYDTVLDFLKIKNSKSPILKKIGSIIKNKNKVKLDYYLGSMDKIKPTSNHLELWKKKYNGTYNLSDKLDGISALLVYNLDKKINLYTRGTSDEGLNITKLIKYLKLPNYSEIYNYCNKNKIIGNKNLIAFRGELVLKKDIFKTKWSIKFKNARNTIAGLVNSKYIDPNLAYDLDLVLYEIVDPFFNIKNQFKIISELNFNIVNNKYINNYNDLTYENLSLYYKKRRNIAEYDIDGIIVTSCENNIRNVKDNPEYAFAYKDILDEQIAQTKVIDIEWNISKHGYIKPTIIIEPTIIGSVKINRVTGNNAQFIVTNNIGPGTIIKIIRSGDVIPKIIEILKSTTALMPKINFHWNETKVDIILDKQDNNKDLLIKNIYFFFSNLDAEGLGEKNISKLIDANIDTIPKILGVTKEQLLNIDGIKEKKAMNLINSIKKCVTNISLSKLMTSSNKLGFGIGYEKIKHILLIYPNILNEYNKWTEDIFINNIIKINGFEEKTATLFVKNFNNFIKFYNSIKKYIILEKNKNILINNLLNNKIILFSGFRDKNLQNKIEELGGKINSTISKNIDFLIIKDNTILDTTKVKKALELKIKIITKDNFIKLIN